MARFGCQATSWGWDCKRENPFGERACTQPGHCETKKKGSHQNRHLVVLSPWTYGTSVKPQPRALHCFLDSELCRIQGPVHCLKKLPAKPDVCRCKRSLFTKIPPRNASLSADDNQAGELLSHASGQDFAWILPGPAPPWGLGGLRFTMRGRTGQDFTPGREQGSWGQLGSTKSPDLRTPPWWWGGSKVKPESQSAGQDQGGPWLGTGTPTSRLRWRSKGAHG